MIARLLAACALLFTPLFLTGAAAPDWTRTVRATPAGGRLVGNPAAKVKLIEFASYTCPHCAHFAQAASPTLTQSIRSGRLSVELRPIVFEQIGLAAAVLARCVPPARFWAVNDALFARQGQWSPSAFTYAQANAEELSRYTAADRIEQIAIRGGIAQAAGLTGAQAAACFNQRLIEDTARAADAAGAIASSTPTFMIGTQKFDRLDWAGLSPKLRAAGLN